MQTLKSSPTYCIDISVARYLQTSCDDNEAVHVVFIKYVLLLEKFLFIISRTNTT